MNSYLLEAPTIQSANYTIVTPADSFFGTVHAIVSEVEFVKSVIIITVEIPSQEYLQLHLPGDVDSILYQSVSNHDDPGMNGHYLFIKCVPYFYDQNIEWFEMGCKICFKFNAEDNFYSIISFLQSVSGNKVSQIEPDLAIKKYELVVLNSKSNQDDPSSHKKGNVEEVLITDEPVSISPTAVQLNPLSASIPSRTAISFKIKAKLDRQKMISTPVYSTTCSHTSDKSSKSSIEAEANIIYFGYNKFILKHIEFEDNKVIVNISDVSGGPSLATIIIRLRNIKDIKLCSKESFMSIRVHADQADLIYELLKKKCDRVDSHIPAYKHVIIKYISNKKFLGNIPPAYDHVTREVSTEYAKIDLKVISRRSRLDR